MIDGGGADRQCGLEALSNECNDTLPRAVARSKQATQVKSKMIGEGIVCEGSRDVSIGSNKLICMLLPVETDRYVLRNNESC